MTKEQIKKWIESAKQRANKYDKKQYEVNKRRLPRRNG